MEICPLLACQFSAPAEPGPKHLNAEHAKIAEDRRVGRKANRIYCCQNISPFISPVLFKPNLAAINENQLFSDRTKIVFKESAARIRFSEQFPGSYLTAFLCKLCVKLAMRI